MTFYHVDRTQKLKPGQIIDPYFPTSFSFPDDFEQETVLNALEQLYRNQLSYHGNHYAFVNPDSPDIIPTAFLVESIFETVRLCCYPNNLSRFQSFYAFGSLEDSIGFFGKQYPVFEVESNSFHKGDIHLLDNACFLQSYEKAHMYWKSQSSPNPLYEYLLSFPVTVKSCVYPPFR